MGPKKRPRTELSGEDVLASPSQAAGASVNSSSTQQFGLHETEELVSSDVDMEPSLQGEALLENHAKRLNQLFGDDTHSAVKRACLSLPFDACGNPRPIETLRQALVKEILKAFTLSKPPTSRENAPFCSPPRSSNLLCLSLIDFLPLVVDSTL